MRGGLRVFGHPMHVMLVHFPVALWPASFAADAIWLWRREEAWAHAAFWCMAAGVAAALVAATTGLVDYLSIPEKHPAAVLATRHMTIMARSASLFAVSLLLRGAVVPLSISRFAAAASVSAVGLVLLFIGAWMGGELVLRHGVGRVENGP